MRRLVPIALALVTVFGCKTIDQQKAQPAKTDNAQFHNLKVLPVNISHDELLATMRGFARALGTRCDFCHAAGAPGADGRPQLDFASDAKPQKENARTMIRMTRAINADYIKKVEPEMDNPVTCGTCHRGHQHPEPFNPPAPEQRAAPSPAPQP